jgi:hypothetical protein
VHQILHPVIQANNCASSNPSLTKQTRLPTAMKNPA